ncbi:transporter [Hyphomicrobium sp.]|uniref:SphA family protein n=1 Tax=Hyphomicrobium sp. TaxID=82 RepID=UPI0025C5AC9A|nr:transporter [Hyphomicrobium sp.]MCC7253580.1 transporter [Hyphomicrobium sp.]
MLLTIAFMCGAWVPAGAVEGPTVAGPIGGTDLRAALLPPPGIYVGTVQLVARTIDFLDKDGRTIPALADAQLTKEVGGPFLTYVPPTTFLGGNVAFSGFIPAGHSCGRLFAGTSRECDAGLGDPYVEIAWSRYFGTPRASEFDGVLPIPEGFALMLGIGAVIPIGRFKPSDPLSQALSMGTNIWDWAPTVAVTYTTPPILAEGTEFSAKLYWNNYIENSETDYLTGDLLNVDFAVTEHIGRFQVGLAGFYAWQIEDDKIAGVSFPPDGRRARTLQIGGVVAYDMPEHEASLKLKAMASPFAQNTVTAWNVVFSWGKKF